MQAQRRGILKNMDQAIEPTQELPPLSDKHQLVLEHYLTCWNQTEAYARVYNVDRHSASVLAWRLFKQPNFAAHLNIRREEIHMTADEAIKLTSDIARGDVARIMDVSSVGFSLDMSKAQELGLTKLIKKVRQKTTTFLARNESQEDREVHELEVELYDAQAAQRDILRLHGRFPESSRRTNADTPPAGAIVALPAAIVELVSMLEQRQRQATDAARSADGTVTD